MKKIVILLLSIGFFSSCKHQERNPIPVTVTYEDAIPVELNDTVTASKQEEIRLWSSKETKLPIGVIETMDCANWGKEGENTRDNYVLVRKPDGVSTIKSDIDVDLFLCINKGDKIIE